jgi:hypothetical protein
VTATEGPGPPEAPAEWDVGLMANVQLPACVTVNV